MREELDRILIDFGPMTKFHVAAPFADNRSTLCGAELQMYRPKIRGYFRVSQVERNDICQRCLKASSAGEGE